MAAIRSKSSVKLLARAKCQSHTRADLDRVGADVEKFYPHSKMFTAAGTKVEAQWRKL